MSKTQRSADRPILDSTLIGGQAFADYLSGRVHDSDLSPTIVEAFKLQYPRLAETTTFSDHIRDLDGSPERLAGFLAGIKGKYFELQAVDYLNSGHLPDGLHAVLADSATQPGFDIELVDQHGHIVDVVQAKATSAHAIVEAVQKYPDVHKFVTVAENGGLDLSHTTVDALPITNEHLDAATGHASDAVLDGHDFHLPYLAGLAIAVTVIIDLRRGVASHVVADNAAVRALGATGAWGALYVVGALNPLIGIGAAVATRLVYAHVVRTIRSRIEAEHSIAQELVRGQYVTEEAARRAAEAFHQFPRVFDSLKELRAGDGVKGPLTPDFEEKRHDR